MPPSKESEALKALFERFTANSPAEENLFLEQVIYDQVQNASTEVPDVKYETVTVADRPAIWARPDGASQTHAMLFMHGGGFSFGSPNSHRKLTAHLAKACNCPALSIDYRLSPEFPYPIPLNDCVNAYKFLLDSGIPAGNIVLAGDSCGGMLSTAVPLAAQKAGLPTPGASVSLSPWYDMTSFNGSMDTNETNDVLNSKEGVNKLAERYTAGNKDLRNDPLVSPLKADLTGLPPHWISCAGFDMLLDHGTRLAAKAKEAGVEVVLEVHEGQQHVFEFMAGKAPEADESIRKIGEWVRQKIGS